MHWTQNEHLRFDNAEIFYGRGNAYLWDVKAEFGDIDLINIALCISYPVKMWDTANIINNNDPV